MSSAPVTLENVILENVTRKHLSERQQEPEDPPALCAAAHGFGLQIPTQKTVWLSGGARIILADPSRGKMDIHKKHARQARRPLEPVLGGLPHW